MVKNATFQSISFKKFSCFETSRWNEQFATYMSQS